MIGFYVIKVRDADGGWPIKLKIAADGRRAHCPTYTDTAGTTPSMLLPLASKAMDQEMK
jgi:hypothetical protein